MGCHAFLPTQELMVGESGIKTREEGLSRFFSGYGRKPWVPSTYARDEGTTRRGTATPVHRPQRPAGSTHSSTRGLRPPEHPVEFGAAPPNCTVSLTSQRHPEKLPEVTDTIRGNPGFPAATRERPRESFFTRLDARFPYHD